ncbi:MAG: hypothetical protein EHM78_25180 [Myxococcaceae bacterium]|nr:MAG: hypothetical protein EHM78_25180 [Myxococcaceae bacterium]
MTRKESSASSPAWVARTELLLDLVRLDTAYADLYRQRAREIAASEFSGLDFKALKNAEQAVQELPADIRRGMDDGKWDQVKKLTDELGAKQRFLQERGSLHKIGERLYEDVAIHVDPFSPGFFWYHRREERQLPGLRDEAMGKLGRAAEIDPEWKPLYQERAKGLKAVRLAEPSASAGAAKGRGEMEQRAREALAAGNLEELQKLAGNLHQGGAGPDGPAAAEATEDVQPDPLTFAFSSETLQKAKALGLEPEHFDNMRAKFRGLFRHLWHPVFFEAEGNLAGARVSAMLPKDTPDAQRDRIVMFVTRPVLSSGGARFLPPLVDEDLLVETFDEGPAGAEVGKNGLAEALGLKRRWGLDRMTIERSIQEKGPEMVKSLGLDPWKFRLVCVPPDVYGAASQRRGWSKHEIWTHLDGYLATRERKLLALAGGDVRYGGFQDLVGVGVEYDSDRLLARFAIVNRGRLRAW